MVASSKYGIGPGTPGQWEGLDLLRAAYRGDIDRLRLALDREELRTVTDPETGLNLLHLAVGTNNFPLARFLVEEIGVPFKPDFEGRWPSLIAVECGVSDELGAYIVEKESAYPDLVGLSDAISGQDQTDQTGPQQPGLFFPKT